MKNFVYIILFLLVLVVPPFGVIAGFMFILVHYMERDTQKKEEAEAARPQPQYVTPKYNSYQEELAAKKRATEEQSIRNRERNLTIKSDPEGE